jgi:hypothetical protein
MSKAFHFMEQTDPAEFLAAAMAEATNKPQPREEAVEPTLDSVTLPPPDRAAA